VRHNQDIRSPIEVLKFLHGGDLHIIKFPAPVSEYIASEEKENNYIGEKIAEARAARKITQTRFCELLAQYGVEIGIQGLSKWESGRSVPNAYQLIAASFALGLEDDLSYFVKGHADLNAEGQKKLKDYKTDLIASGRYKPEILKKKKRMVEMPVSNLRASAGTGSFLDEGSFEMVRFPETMVPEGAEFGIYVSGDSMEPVYHDGQIVWVKESNDLFPGEVGIFMYDGNGYIKEYDEKEPEGDQQEEFMDSYGKVHKQPIMISYNEKYRPIVVSPHSEFRIVGRVL